VSEFDPLVERVDALLKRHQQPSVPPSPPVVPPQVAKAPEAVEASEVLQPPIDDPALASVLPQDDAEADDDIPVLTEIVDFAPTPVEQESVQPGSPGPATVPFDEKALVEEIESAVLEKVLAELDRSLEMRLNRSIGNLLDQALDGLRAELSASVRESVREAVKSAVAKEDADRADS
jgi:hypothetical protein